MNPNKRLPSIFLRKKKGGGIKELKKNHGKVCKVDPVKAEGLIAFPRNHNISDPRAGGIRKCAEARLPSHNKAGKATPAARLSGAAPGPPARPQLGPGSSPARKREAEVGVPGGRSAPR